MEHAIGAIPSGNHSEEAATRAAAAPPRFYSVAQVAEIFGTSPVTLYRAIRAGEFPAIRIRGRLIVPAKAIDAMADAAVTHQTVVAAVDWTVRR